MRKMVHGVLAVLCLAGSAPAVAQPSAPPPLEITLEEGTAKATGVTAGAQVAWLSVWRDFPEASLRITRIVEVTEDEDRDGATDLELEAAAPHQSVWVAVDLTSGAIAVEAPEGYPLQTPDFRPGAIQVGHGGSGDLLEQDRRFLLVLLVRPGVGAWSEVVGDGGQNDVDDEGNGRLTLAFESLQPLAESPPLQPAVLKPGDVLVSIDMDSLETSLARLPGAPQS